MNEPSEEVWLPAAGYEDLYEVSNFGRVRSLRNKTRIKDKDNRIMCQKNDGHGYYRINLHKDGKCKGVLVSRLVAETFIPNPSSLPIVGHMDDNKINNTVENLYWTDSKENNHHNGKMDRFHAIHRKKIEDIAKALSTPIVCLDEETGETIFFDSMQEAVRILGADSGKISMCCNGLRKHHMGKVWMFV